MNIKCFMVEPTDEERRAWRNPATGEIKAYPHSFGPGAMWWGMYTGVAPDGALDESDHALWVRLPNNAGDFCLEERSTRTGQKWQCSGDAPTVTVTPSINAVGRWHGWLRNGELVDA